MERAETALSVETLSKLLESFRPDGSAFAFEQDSTLEAYTLLPETSPAVPAASVTCPCDSRFHEALATALDFNPYGDTSYTDAAGTVYYSETGCALQISPTGEILLTSTAADRFRAAGPETAELVEEARRLVSLAAGDSAGEARLYLSGITASEEETVCTFTYYLSGIAVNTGSPAARVVFSGQSVSRMEVQALQFTTTARKFWCCLWPRLPRCCRRAALWCCSISSRAIPSRPDGFPGGESMPVSKLKNLAILILLLANLALLAVLIPNRLARAREADRLRETLSELCAAEDVALSPNAVPNTVDLYALELGEDEEADLAAATALLGQEVVFQDDSTRYLSRYTSGGQLRDQPERGFLCQAPGPGRDRGPHRRVPPAAPGHGLYGSGAGGAPANSGRRLYRHGHPVGAGCAGVLRRPDPDLFQQLPHRGRGDLLYRRRAAQAHQ